MYAIIVTLLAKHTQRVKTETIGLLMFSLPAKEPLALGLHLQRAKKAKRRIWCTDGQTEAASAGAQGAVRQDKRAKGS